MGSRVAHPGQSRYLVSDASNGLAWRRPVDDTGYDDASTSGGFVSTSYTDTSDADPGGQVLPTVTVTTGTRAIVLYGCKQASNSSAGQFVDMSFSVSGATTIAAANPQSIRGGSATADHIFNLEGSFQISLTAGSNTFQVEALVSGGTGTIVRPRILVWPL